MPATGLRRALRWALGISGVLGLLCAASMLLVTVAEYGGNGAVANLAMKVPYWAQLGAAPPAAISMLVVGFLSLSRPAC